MDPLSVAASIAGLLIAGVEVSAAAERYLSAGSPSVVQSIKSEIHDFTAVLSQIQPLLLGPTFPSTARSSMIDVDQVLITLTGCVCTFSELEKEVNATGLGLKGKVGIRTRIKLAGASSTIAQLIQQLQNHKSSLLLMLSILTCQSNAEANNSMNQLCPLVKQLVESNNKILASNYQLVQRSNQISDRLNALESTSSASALNPNQQNYPISISSVRTSTSPRRVFEATLLKTRLYKRALLNNSIFSLSSSASPTGHWSVLSGISLAEISNLSVLCLPICASQLENPACYGGSLATAAVPDPLDQPPNPPLTDQPPPVPLLYETIQTYETTVRRLQEQATFRYQANRYKLLSESFSGANPKAVLSLLLVDDVDIEYKVEPGGFTALHGASIWGHKNVARILLDCGANKEASCAYGFTPLQLAIRFGGYETVQLLLERGANYVARDGDGHTALQSATVYGHLNIVRLLLEMKAAGVARVREQYTLSQLEKRYGHDYAGITPGVDIEIHTRDGPDNFYELDAWLDTAASADTSDEDAVTYPPFHMVAMRGQKESVEVLIETGEDVEETCWSGYRALHLAAAYGRGEVVKLLHEAGADIDSKGPLGRTPLHLAAMWGRSKTAMLLLECGADRKLRTTEGESAYTLAMGHGYTEIAEGLWKRHL